MYLYMFLTQVATQIILKWIMFVSRSFLLDTCNELKAISLEIKNCLNEYLILQRTSDSTFI